MSTHNQRRPSSSVVAIILFVGCLALASRATANNCVNGGEPRPDEGGVGGTGLRPMGPDDDDSGVGGTGISARGDTGVIGTVTGFASICVGGLEIHYGTDTPVQMDGESATAAQLAVGQVVEVVATGSGAEMSARQITVRHVVSGPVTGIDEQSNQIEVMGETVQLWPGTRTGDGAGEAGADATFFPLHSAVQVSGMRRGDGIVVASRVSSVAPGQPVHVVGAVSKLDSGMLWVAGTPVRPGSDTPVSIGDEVHVVGDWDGYAIVARAAEMIPRVPFAGRVARLDIEGFASQSAAGQLQVGPFSVELPSSAAQELTRLSAVEARVRIQGVVQGRRVIVQRIGVMDELPALPPLPQKDLRGWNGGKPDSWRDAFGAAPPDPSAFGGRQAPPGIQGQNMRPDGSGGFGPPPGPMGNDRPPAPQLPERPPMPRLPERPLPPERPPRPERPSLPVRPELPRRP